MVSDQSRYDLATENWTGGLFTHHLLTRQPAYPSPADPSPADPSPADLLTRRPADPPTRHLPTRRPADLPTRRPVTRLPAYPPLLLLTPMNLNISLLILLVILAGLLVILERSPVPQWVNSAVNGLDEDTRTGLPRLWQRGQKLLAWLGLVAIADGIIFVATRLDALPPGVQLNGALTVALLLIMAVRIAIDVLGLSPFLNRIRAWLAPFQFQSTYQRLIEPDLDLVKVVAALAIAEVTILFTDQDKILLQRLEFVSSLALAIATGIAAFRIFKRFFDNYILDVTVSSGSKVNSEFLVLIRLLANAAIVVVTVLLFAQTHQINVIGLIASLGIGGLAVAFAAQRTLEQLLGGIVLYIDRPFVIGDYIGIKETFGKVESIGLRSTKIRISGRGTLMVIPNNALTQAHIENFTDAKKVISLLNLNFYREIGNQERALIQQVILESTTDIFGIDSRSTTVSFRQLTSADNQQITQVQVTFFILGSGTASLELRRQILDIANQNIARRLKDFGITFTCEEPTIYVDSPITV